MTLTVWKMDLGGDQEGSWDREGLLKSGEGISRELVTSSRDELNRLVGELVEMLICSCCISF